MAHKLIIGTKVILRRKIENPVEGLNYNLTLRTSAGENQLVYEWTKKNDYTTEVPTKVEYEDTETQRTVLSKKNLAQDWLNAYPGVFEVVGEVKQEIIKQPTIVVSEVDRLKAQLAEEERKRVALESKINEQQPAAAREVEPPKKKGRPKAVKQGVVEHEEAVA